MPERQFPSAQGRAFSRARSRQSGFTLVELIISAGLVGFIAIAATWFWVDGLSLARTVNGDSAAMAEGRATLERLSREVREVKYHIGLGSYCISSMTATRLVFNKHNPTGAERETQCGGTVAAQNTAANDYPVTIEKLSTSDTINLTLGTAAARPISTMASSFSMRYLNTAGVEITPNANVTDIRTIGSLRFIELNLTLRPDNQTPATTLKTLVALRSN